MKRKNRHKQKKKGNRFLWIVIAVIGIGLAAVAVCVAGMFIKENNRKTPEELLVEYMNHIAKREYEQMYAMIHYEASNSVSQEDFIERNSTIYEGIEIQDMEVEVIAYDKERMAVTYQTSFQTAAGHVSFENEASFLKSEEGYELIWDDSLIFPDLLVTDKVKVSTTQAIRGEILDRNGQVLAGKGTASSVGIVPGRLENRDEAIREIAELLETTPEAIEKKLSAKWVKDDFFVPIKTIPKVEEIELMTIEPDEEVLKENERHEKLLEIPGVMISDIEVREYSLGEAAAHLTGYVQNVTAEDLEKHAGEGYTASSVIGRSGMESLFEKELKGQNGCSICIVNADGNVKEELANMSVQHGQNIQLTIDAELQASLYEQFKEDKSCSTAINPYTGEVLALVSTPSYDSNDFIMGFSNEKWTALNEDENKPLYNRFRQVWYSGTAFEPIIEAIDLESEAVNTAKELESSLNRLGFNEELPFEMKMAESQYSNTENDETKMQVLINPLHMACIYSAFCNEGNVIKPYLIYNPDAEPEYWIPDAFSENTANLVLKEIEEVINDSHGTAYALHREDVLLAGKTGTAEIKAAEEDASGTELGWVVAFTAEKTEEHPIMIVSMAEDIKERGGSDYVVEKDKEVLDAWFNRREDESDFADAESIAVVYRDIYDEAVETNTLGSPETMQRIVARLGENGYVAVDSKNQVDMVRAEQAATFCKAVDEKKNAKLTIIVIQDTGFRKFDLEAENGNVNIVRGYYQYGQNGCLQNRSTVSYPADTWKYTEEGYLLFDGSYLSEDIVLTLSDTPEHTALRVLPLDEKCRELNRKYILPVGYKQNNIFLTDWNEKDFGDLDFYDIFDIFYPILYKQSVPYAADKNIGVGAVYQIPEDVFENVITAHLNIDRESLRRGATYFPENRVYEYRPRGFYEAEYPDIPYPEVINYSISDADEDNPNGVITLIVNAVYPNENTSKAYSHRTVIRPLGEDCFQYVSNQMISLEDENDIWWHSNRLTKEEWLGIYGGMQETVVNKAEKGYDLPISDSERKEAEADCRKMMGLISELYKDAEKGHASNPVIPEETMYQLVEKVKDTGYPVTTTVPYSNMENYKKLEDFLNASMKGRSGSAVVYEIHLDGGMGRYKYFYDGNDMYVLSARAAWSGDNKPMITDISYARIKEWKLTEKGWFCYKLCVPEYPEVTEMVDGSCLIRVKPMTEEEREISEKCVQGLGYQGNNLLCSNWDSEHMEGLDYNGLYEYLYAMKYQKKFNSENYPNGIQKEEFENLIMEYLPVTAEQLQEYAVFDEKNQTYAWIRLGCFNYDPTFFGTSMPEVTDIRENKDGTVTLTVDAVCSMILCDDAVITHELTVQFAEDGSFRYLGNKILDDGITRIPDYQYRITRE